LLAGLLEPSDFGTVAISIALYSLLNTVLGTSFGITLVQRKDDAQDAANLMFWMGLAIGIIIFAFFFISAPTIAQLYDDPILSDVLRVMMLAVPIYMLGVVPYNLLWRDMAFDRMFWVTAVPRVVSSLLSIVWALLGGGVWSLVIGPLVAEIIITVVSWRAVSWYPKWHYNGRLVKEILNYSSWIFADRIINWAVGQGDNIIAGLFLQASLLGAYTVGYNYSLILPTLVIGSLSLVTMSAMSRLQSEVVSIGHDMLQMQSRAATFFLPMIFATSAFVPRLFDVLYGNKWAEMGDVLLILSLLPAMMVLWQFNIEALRSIGRPDVWPKAGILSLIFGGILLFISGPFGILAFTFARSLAVFPYIGLMMYVTKRHLYINVRDQLNVLVRPLIAAMTTYIVANIMIAMFGPFVEVIDLLKLAAIGLASGVFYLGFLWIFYRNLFNTMIYTLRQVIGR
jgi:PST family polysaccharide transporter